jgi:hypothetical protein
MWNDPFVIFLLTIAGLYLSLELYFGILDFIAWIKHKFKLFLLGMGLIIKGESKLVKNIGWAALKLVFWESKDKKE